MSSNKPILFMLDNLLVWNLEFQIYLNSAKRLVNKNASL